MSVLLKADAVHKTYVIGRTHVNVLAGASLAVSAGETVAVVGRSGAGKTTLLHILGGLDRPDEGAVQFDGQDMYAMPKRRLAAIRADDVGFVFQAYHLLPEMDVLENVMLAGLARASCLSSRARLRARARELLVEVGLEGRAAHTPLELSGGEQQRVALARALMNGPRLMLADEPTGNLDRATGGRVLETLFSLVRGSGRALVLVTHDAGTAALCDRVLHLEGGLLEAPEPPRVAPTDTRG